MSQPLSFIARMPLMSSLEFATLMGAISVALNAIQARVLWRGAQDLQGFEKSYNFQPYFNYANLFVNSWSLGTLVSVVENQYIGSVGLTMIGLGVTVFALTTINNIADRYFRTSTLLDQTKAEIRRKPQETFFLRWGRPFSAHNFALWINVSQLCLNLVLAIFSSSPLFYVINLALNGYALYTLAQRKWLQVVRERIYEQSADNKIQSILVSFNCFFMPAAKQTAEICQHCKQGDPDTYFHQNHLFHEKCLIRYLVKKSEDLTEIRNIRDSRFSVHSSNRRYYYEAPKACRPGCPSCGQEPFYNEVSFQITLFNPGSQSAVVEWKETPIGIRT